MNGNRNCLDKSCRKRSFQKQLTISNQIGQKKKCDWKTTSINSLNESNYSKSLSKTARFKHLHKGMVDENNYIVYKISPKKQIVIINFRDGKQKSIY